MNHKIGIMSGRLSSPINNNIQQFPSNSWKNEFEKASKLGFDLIEWIFDLSKNNPIMIPEGLIEIKELSEKYNVSLRSICADFFMEKKLFAVSEYELEKNLQVLKNLICNCNHLGVSFLEIPLVENSSISEISNREEFITNIIPILKHAQENNVFLTLETDLSCDLFKKTLEKINHPNIAANYDIGNSISLGYDPSVELPMLSPWIKNIHIKDRKLHSGTFPLGTGDVNFDLFFSSLAKINYNYDFIIQGAREDLTDPSILPELTCSKYLKFVKHYVSKYLN